MPDEHAKLSPSGFSRWSKCPGSIKLGEGIKDESSPAAQWGTDAHTILEGMLREWIEFADYKAVKVDEYQEKSEVALVAYRYVVEEYGKAMKSGTHPKVFIEQKVYTRFEECWGSADIILSTDTMVEVIDLKAGSGVQVNPDSGQLKIYALGALELNATARWVKTTIVQPRIDHPDGPIRSDIMTRDELLQWGEDVFIPAVNDAIDPNAKLYPGESQCRWCKAQSICPALANQAKEIALSCFEDQTGKTLDDMGAADPQSLSAQKIAEIIDAAPMIRGWLKAVEDYALDQLRQRKPIPGYKAIYSGGRNQWSLSDDEVVASLDKVGISRDLLTRESVLTAPQALKIKGLTHDQRVALEALVVKSQGNLKIVPESHDAADAFADLFQDISFLD